jgi:Arc/MetJ-type ribon-helix-helix transcriptional regulator
MSTLSVPLTSELEDFLEEYIKQNKGSSKAEVVRRALYDFAENEAVLTVLKSEQEVSEGKIIKGNLKDLLQ